MKPWHTVSAVALSAAMGGAIASNLVAWNLGFQAALGSPLAHWHAWPIYAPWKILQWAPWAATVPDIRSGLIITACAAALPLIGAVMNNKPSFGKEEWGTRKDAKEAGLLGKAPDGGVVLGKIGRETMVFTGDQHTLVAGASGSGKSAGPCVSTLLSIRDRSVLVFDPKGELYKMTAPFRSTLGAAFFFDPTEPDSACFNPLDEIIMGTSQEIAAAHNIASILIDSSGLRNAEPIWPITATDLLTALILFALRGPAQRRNLGALRDMMFDLPSTLEAMAECPHPECKRIAETMLPMNDKIADSISLVARSSLSAWSDPLVVAKTSRSDFRISDLAAAKYPVSCYIQVPPSDRDRLMPLFRLFLVQVLKAFLRRPGIMADGRMKLRRLQLIADEFPAMGKIPGFAQDIQEFRGYGISVMMLCQSLHSLEELYGRSQVIRDNCHIVTCFASSDTDSMRDVSIAVGDGVETRVSESSRSGFWGSGKTKSTSKGRRALLSPGDVRQLSMDDAIVLITGTKPIRARKARWFEHRLFKRLGVNLKRYPDTPLIQHEGIAP